MVSVTVGEFLTTVGLHDGHCVYEITRDKAQAYRRALLSGTTLKQLGAARPRKAVTSAKRLGMVKMFTKFLHANDYLESDPFAGLLINAHQLSASKLRKEAWSQVEIEMILTALEPDRYATNSLNREWFWFILSMMGSGCRAAEMVNRDVGDVKQDGASWLWDICRATDKPVENVFSIRRVPIPRVLLEAGYLCYVRARQEGGKLFPLHCNAGSVMISLKFARLTKRLGIYTRTKTMHSIRAFHAVAMELGGVHPSLARTIAGHQVAGDVHGVYLHSLKFPIERMQEAVDVVRLPVQGERTMPLPPEPVTGGS